jgi:hypothetical protein
MREWGRNKFDVRGFAQQPLVASPSRPAFFCAISGRRRQLASAAAQVLGGPQLARSQSEQTVTPLSPAAPCHRRGVMPGRAIAVVAALAIAPLRITIKLMPVVLQCFQIFDEVLLLPVTQTKHEH